MGLIEELAAREGGARDGVVEGFGLRFCRGWGREGRLDVRGRRRVGQEVDLFGDGTAKVVEGFADVGRIVVGFVRVLGAKERLGISGEGDMDRVKAERVRRRT